MYNEVRSSLYKKNENPKFNTLLNVLIVVVVLVLFFEIFFAVNYSGVYVVKSSMEPTLNGAVSEDKIGGDYVYINKNATPDYGDIVVVYQEQYGYIIKRAIAFGGDRVKIVGGKLQIMRKGATEFEDVDEKYLADDITYNDPARSKNTFPKGADGKVIEEGYPVEDGYIFLLGDNRNVSEDSRDFGAVPLKNLDGVVTEWSVRHKSLLTSFYNFFRFKLSLKLK